jgi:hypothetical protein
VDYGNQPKIPFETFVPEIPIEDVIKGDTGNYVICIMEIELEFADGVIFSDWDQMRVGIDPLPEDAS